MIAIKTFLAVFASVLLFSASVRAGDTEGESLYQIPLKWKSHEDQPVTLSDFKGRKVVISMIYASCQTACPLILKKIKAVKAELDRRGVKAEVVLVTFDSVGDAPMKLRHFRKHNGVEDPAWTFLVGNEKDTRTLSMLLGIKYSKNPANGQIMHDNKILLLNEQGVPVRTLEGLAAEVSELY